MKTRSGFIAWFVLGAAACTSGGSNPGSVGAGGHDGGAAVDAGGPEAQAQPGDILDSAACQALCKKIDEACGEPRCDPKLDCAIQVGQCAESTLAWLQCVVATATFSCGSGGYFYSSNCTRDASLCAPGTTLSDSCVGHCGGKAPSGCGCGSQCEWLQNCCSDYQALCGMGGTGGTGGTAGNGGTGGEFVDGGSDASSCSGITCTTPPSPVCSNGMTLSTYSSLGACFNGTCNYNAQPTLCPGGCANGQCEALTCVVKLDSIDLLDPPVSWYPADPALAVDGAGGLHVAYYAQAPKDLRYAYRPPGGSWQITTVDSTDSAGTYVAIGVDAKGGVHIAYHENVNDDLKVAYRAPAGGWTLETVDQAGQVGYRPSLALDSSGGIDVSYASLAGEVKIAHKPAGGVWTVAVLASSVGEFSSLAVDSSATMHVTYADWSGDLKHAFKPAGGVFAVEAVEPGADVKAAASMAIDSSSKVHLAYFDFAQAKFKYATHVPAGLWDVVTVDVNSGPLADRALALDASGAPHMAYASPNTAGPNTVAYVRRAPSGAWNTIVVDSGVDHSQPALAMGAAPSGSTAHLVFGDSTNSVIKHAEVSCP